MLRSLHTLWNFLLLQYSPQGHLEPLGTEGSERREGVGEREGRSGEVDRSQSYWPRYCPTHHSIIRSLLRQFSPHASAESSNSEEKSRSHEVIWPSQESHVTIQWYLYLDQTGSHTPFVLLSSYPSKLDCNAHNSKSVAVLSLGLQYPING